LKSYEEHLSESCPALIAWHKLVWEDKVTGPPPAEEDDVLTEETIIENTEPIIKEWRTINGNRRIDNDFANNMTVGY